MEKRSYSFNRLPWKENSSVGPTFSFTAPPLLLLPLPFPSAGTKQEMKTQRETLLSVEEQLHDLGGRGRCMLLVGGADACMLLVGGADACMLLVGGLVGCGG